MSVLLFSFTPALAGKADVLDVEAVKLANGTYRFDVTIQHADEGLQHYTDRWEVVGPDGTVLAVRNLYHPHVDEQPLTRSLSGVCIPKGITTVTVRAHDSVHGYGGKTVTEALPSQ